jgi:hypothetical protein
MMIPIELVKGKTLGAIKKQQQQQQHGRGEEEEFEYSAVM